MPEQISAALVRGMLGPHGVWCDVCRQCVCISYSYIPFIIPCCIQMTGLSFAIARTHKRSLKTIRVGTKQAFTKPFTRYVQTACVWSCCLNTTALLAATGSADFTCKLWNAVTGFELATWPHPQVLCCIPLCSPFFSYPTWLVSLQQRSVGSVWYCSKL